MRTKIRAIQFKVVVKFLMGFFIALLSLGGQFPFRYSFRKKKFVHSYFMVLYTLTLLTLFLYAYGNKIIEENTKQQFDIRNVGKVYEYLNVISVIVSFLSVLMLKNEALNYLNSVPIFEVINFLQTKIVIQKSPLLIIILKIVTIPVVLEFVLFLREMREESESPLLSTFNTFLPCLIANITPNCIFGMLVVNKQMMLGLINILEDIAKDVNNMQTESQMNLQKPYYRMQRFCNLADELDELAIKYTQIVEGTAKFVDLLGAPYLCALVCNLFGITAGLFAQYHAIADSLIYKERYDTVNALISSVFLIISLVEITLQAHLCNESVVVAKKTGYILQDINLLHADIRFKQSVEEFSFLVLVKKFKFQPWGLLEIDVSLLHDVLSAVTSFLLILIQSDLALRFSLT